MGLQSHPLTTAVASASSENGTNDTAAEAAMHKDQVELASHYALAIAGWGEDAASQPVEHREEEKLANMPENYGVVKGVLKRNVSCRNYDIKQTPPEPDSPGGSVPAATPARTPARRRTCSRGRSAPPP